MAQERKRETVYHKSDSDMYLWLKRERERLIMYPRVNQTSICGERERERLTAYHKSELDMYLWLKRERKRLILYRKSESDMSL